MQLPLRMECAMFEIGIYFLIALLIVILVGKKVKFSKRYDRREMTDWKKLDEGIDPSVEGP